MESARAGKTCFSLSKSAAPADFPAAPEVTETQWMGAIYDNLEFLISLKTKEELSNKIDYLFDTGKVEIEALAYLRGRSLPDQYMIVDDAQNLTPHEVKTIVSHAGKGSKVILTGDPYQIDNSI